MEAGRLSLPSRELESTWNAVRAELHRSAGDLAFHLWLEPLALAAHEEDVLYVRAPRHIRTIVEERHLPLLRRAAETVLQASVAIRVVGEDWRGVEQAEPAGSACAPKGWVRGPDRSAAVLNPRYTFEQFVIGGGNRLAHGASLAVAEQPAQTYNPLFLHGAPGLGKTHLLQAIGNYVRRFGAGLTVRYATSEEFTSGFVHAVRSGSVDEFKTRFRAVDVLLVDDVQFLGERARTQEEFFHTFNGLYEAGCQIVISSDRPPREMTAFEQRLAERFGSGLVAQVEAPTHAVRMAILRKRARLDRLFTIDDAVLAEIARDVTSSVRALEGALTRVVAYASLRGEQPTPTLARNLLTRLYASQAEREPTIEEIQAATADAFDTDTKDMCARDRRPRVAFARQVAMYLARELTDETLPSIGASFGGRSHTTVLHAHRLVTAKVAGASPDAVTVGKVRAQLESA